LSRSWADYSAVFSAAAPVTFGCPRWFTFSEFRRTSPIKGNVDILIALVMNTGAAIGAQIGAISTQYFAGPKIRLAFVPLPLIGAAIVIYTLMTGHKL
jgi:uncharacterized membrane protein YfcA